MPYSFWPCFAAVWLLSSSLAFSQSVIFSDAFDGAGTTVDAAIWPGNSGTRVESSGGFFGPTNRYLFLSGGGTKALSADYSPRLAGQTSTFTFDFYEPDTATDAVILGYAATTSDINAAGAYVRLSVGGGNIDLNATEGTAVVLVGNTNYPRNTPLTFSLLLNDTTNTLPWLGTNLAPRTLEVWYATPGQSPVHALSVSTATSIRTPVCVGFRTWSASTGARAYVDNVRLIEALVLGTNSVVPVENSQAIIPARPFVHPSLYNTAQEIERIRHRVLNEPGSVAAVGWNQLLSSGYASLSYAQVPYSNVVVMGSGTTPSETQFRADAQAARGLAMRWTISGDTRYRDKARQILNDWADEFALMTPASGTSTSQIELECAWAAPIWVAAADVIRYYNNGSAGWTEAEIARFDGMLDYMYIQAAKSAGRENNWGASAALAMITVGNYQEDRARFNAGLQTWRNRLVGINKAVDSYNDDSIYEVCRDNIHPQYTLTVWAQAAEVAWMHGIDLYGTLMATNNPIPQFARNLEYFAELFLGLRQHPCPTNFAYSYVGQQDRANAYEVGFNHYVVRQGLTSLVDYSNMVVTTCRPGGFDNHFPAWTTLSHGNLSAGVPVATNLALWNLSSGTAVRALVEGETLDLRELTNGYGLAAQVKGTFAAVDFLTNGSRFHYSSNSHTAALPGPGNHFLGVVPRVGVAGGTIPGDVLTRFLRVVDLPKGWTLREFGAPAVPAWAAEQQGSFTLSAAGKGTTGGLDQMGHLSTPISGDAQITARLNPAGLPTSGSMGFSFREYLTSSSRTIALERKGTNLLLSVRNATAGAVSIIATSSIASPAWVRLTRLTNTFRAYHSTDGKDWTLLGTAELALPAEAQLGLAVSSGSAEATAAAVFEQVRIEPLRPGYAAWSDWMLLQRSAIAATTPEGDADGDGLSNGREYLLGLDPLVVDHPAFLLRAESATGGEFVIRTLERANAADWGRAFLFSTNLTQWAGANPISSQRLQESGSVAISEFRFAASGQRGFLKVSYPWVP